MCIGQQADRFVLVCRRLETRAAETRPSKFLSESCLLGAEEAWVQLAFQPHCKLGREQLHDLERPMVQTDALDQAGIVAHERGRSSDIPPERFALPLQIGLGAIDRRARERERIVHAARGGNKERRDGINTLAGPAQD